MKTPTFREWAEANGKEWLTETIDHSLLGCTGRMSKRAKKGAFCRDFERVRASYATVARNKAEYEALFHRAGERAEIEKLKTQLCSIESQLSYWRGFLAANYRPRIAKKQIEMLEAEAEDINQTIRQIEEAIQNNQSR